MQTAIEPRAAVAQQCRIRAVVKRLVIELAHLEAASRTSPNIKCAAEHLDSAIDCLNEYLG